jgi:hypothetical protein
MRWRGTLQIDLKVILGGSNIPVPFRPLIDAEEPFDRTQKTTDMICSNHLWIRARLKFHTS